jgi:hypothetical protein
MEWRRRKVNNEKEEEESGREEVWRIKQRTKDGTER